MKKLMFFVLILMPVLFFGQAYTDEENVPGDPFTEEVPVYPETAKYGIGGVVGAVTVGNITYSQVRLRPQVNVGKFGFGLDVGLLIDSEGNVRKEDWDEWQDYLDKIFYISFASRKDPVYFKIGCIQDYTLGHGLIFEHYSNMLRYPEVKNVGGYVGINTPFSGIGFEAFTHNIHQNEIIALRAHANPLGWINAPLLSKLKLGVNVGIDRNQYGKYADKDGDDIPDIYDKFPNNGNQWLDTDNDGIADNVDFDLNGNGSIDHPDVNPFVDSNFPDIASQYPDYPFDTDVTPDFAEAYPDPDEITVYSLDYQLPLVDTDTFFLDTYGEIATIKDYGNGIIFPGFSSKFLIFDAKLEFRNFGDKFLPGYFDRLYNSQRSEVKYQEIDNGGARHWSLVTKESSLDAIDSSLGWFGFFRANLYDIVFYKMAFQDMYGKDLFMGKSLWASLTVNPTMIPKLKEATLYYSQTNVNYINFRYPRNSNANVMGRLVYAISDNTNLVGRYTEFYNDLNQDGKIKGNDEVLEVFTMGVEFTF
ncbi:MAG: hypothetical protein RBS43_05205 [Candidatus Cloacimonas sp.]|jgi:hypothetical protein|nr:hypothetical protein [Candidatus Cloacimonas sp.]